MFAAQIDNGLVVQVSRAAVVAVSLCAEGRHYCEGEKGIIIVIPGNPGIRQRRMTS